jgi:L-ascorbate metabolism protein UlaG (beta-lactamase superfamily)
MLGMDAGGVSDVGGLKITAVPAAHNAIDRDAHGHCHFLGYVFEFSQYSVNMRTRGVTVGAREWTIYHSGDTKLYPGMADLLRPFNIDVALLPINGDRPERRVAGNLSGKEAAQLAKDINAKLVIPCHYDMFEFNTADPADEFVPECERLGQPYRVLQQGERWSSDELAT